METQEIIRKVKQSHDLIDRIEEYKSYINQLTNGIMAKLGSKEMNEQSISQYNKIIAELEDELKAIWGN